MTEDSKLEFPQCDVEDSDEIVCAYGSKSDTDGSDTESVQENRNALLQVVNHDVPAEAEEQQRHNEARSPIRRLVGADH